LDIDVLILRVNYRSLHNNLLNNWFCVLLFYTQRAFPNAVKRTPMRVETSRCLSSRLCSTKSFQSLPSADDEHKTPKSGAYRKQRVENKHRLCRPRNKTLSFCFCQMCDYMRKHTHLCSKISLSFFSLRFWSIHSSARRHIIIRTHSSHAILFIFVVGALRKF
jgi:hypothetical protein